MSHEARGIAAHGRCAPTTHLILRLLAVAKEKYFPTRRVCISPAAIDADASRDKTPDTMKPPPTTVRQVARVLLTLCSGAAADLFCVTMAAECASPRTIELEPPG